jgi:hypothetical protein
MTESTHSPGPELQDWIDRNEADWARTQSDETLQIELRRYQRFAEVFTGDARIIAKNRTRVFARELKWRRSPERQKPDREREIADRVLDVKRRLPIDEFCRRQLGCQLQSYGKRFKCPCPLPAHKGEKTPSFCLFPEDDHFHCFGCGAHGDIFDLTRQVLGIDGFVQILERLEQESGIAA